MKQRIPVLLFAALHVLASTAAAHDDVANQIKKFTQRIHQSPQDPELYYLRGELYRSRSDYRPALADYNRTLQLNAEFTAALLARGMLFLAWGKPEEAKQDLDKFLSDFPNHSQARVARARALNQMKQPGPAIEDYTLALSQEPQAEIYLERAEVFTAEGEVQRALLSLEEGIQTIGPLISLEVRVIDLELKLKQYDRAIQRIDRITAGAERKEFWLARRAEILEDAGELEKARQSYREALDALHALPESRRFTRSTLELETRLKSALQRLNNGT